MPKRIFMRCVCITFLAICLEGCSAPAAPPPSPTDTATAAFTPTKTKGGGVTQIVVRNPTHTHPPVRTITKSKPRTPTGTPVSICGSVTAGPWESDEHTLMPWMTTPWSMVYFRVGECQIVELQVFVYPARGKGFEGEYLSLQEPIQDREFSISRENPDGPGTLSVYGKFVTSTLCQGFVMFSRGFLVEDYALPDIVTISFTART